MWEAANIFEPTAKMGKNLEDMQEMNRSLILTLIRQAKEISRVKLAKLSGLKQSTVTNITRDLLEWGLIRESRMIDGKNGRRSIGLEVNEKACYVVGVRLTRQSVTAGVFDLEGQTNQSRQTTIDALNGPDEALDRMEQMIDELIRSHAESNIVGIGLATPGPLFRHEGRIALMTDFPGWEKIVLPERLITRFQLPVYLEHDAKAGALAECWFGPNPHTKGTTIYIAAGQGLGAGIVIDGSLYSGATGTAGEIGHMSIALDGPHCQCGNRGCLEQYCSTTTLIRDYRRELVFEGRGGDLGHLTVQDVIGATKRGDHAALKLIRSAGWHLGFGLVGIINAFNPNRIVIGDELSEAGEPFLIAIKEAINRHSLPELTRGVEIVLSAFQSDPVLVGASALALQRILTTPSLLSRP